MAEFQVVIIWLLLLVGCSHNMSVTLQAVQTQRLLHISESAFQIHGTLFAFTYGLLTKCEVKVAGCSPSSYFLRVYVSQ